MSSPHTPLNKSEEVKERTVLTSVPYRRHPLGLPAGSVRAVLAFMVFAMIWVLLVYPEPNPQAIPIYLYYLMFLILGHYFAARGHSYGVTPHDKPPLYLPRGSLRTLMVVGFFAALGWGFYNDPNFLSRLTPPALDQPLLPLILLGAFFLGNVVARMSHHLSSDGVPPWFQDLQAWVSLLAVIGLGAEVVIRLVINPTLTPDQRIHLPEWETILAAIVSFYFGARS